MAFVAGAVALATPSALPALAQQQVPVTVEIREPGVRVDDPGPAVPGAPPEQPAPPAPGPEAEPPAAPVDEQPVAPPPAGEAPPAAPADPVDTPQGTPERPSPLLPRTGAGALRLLGDAAAAIAAGFLLVRAARPASRKEAR